MNPNSVKLSKALHKKYFRQSRTFLHSCYTFLHSFLSQSELSNFFMCVIIIIISSGGESDLRLEVQEFETWPCHEVIFLVKKPLHSFSLYPSEEMGTRTILHRETL